MLYPIFPSSVCIIDVVVVVVIIVIVVIIVVIVTFCSNAISSEINGPIGFKFYMRHPGVGSTKIMEIMIFGLFLCSNAISSEVY